MIVASQSFLPPHPSLVCIFLCKFDKKTVFCSQSEILKGLKVRRRLISLPDFTVFHRFGLRHLFRHQTFLFFLSYSSGSFSRPLDLLLLVEGVLPRGFPVLLLQMASQGWLVGKAGVAVGAAVRALATVQVHVIDQRGLLRESLVTQGALVGFAGAPVHGHVPGEVGRVVEVFAAAGARVQQVRGAGVDGKRLG